MTIVSGRLAFGIRARGNAPSTCRSAFAKAVLGQEIPRESPRDDRVYDLDVFLDPDFVFVPRSRNWESERADVRHMTMRVLGSEPYTISIALGAKTPAHILQQALRGLTGSVKQSMLKVSKVRIRVAFDAGRDGRPRKDCQFDLTWPNSCNLPNDSHGLLIQRMLVAHGIEPRRRRTAMNQMTIQAADIARILIERIEGSHPAPALFSTAETDEWPTRSLERPA